MWNEQQQSEMDAFINNILTDPPPPPKDAQAVQDIEAFLGDVLATGRIMPEDDMELEDEDELLRQAEADVTAMGIAIDGMGKKVPKSKPMDYDLDSLSSGEGGGGVATAPYGQGTYSSSRDKVQGKVQVFISMHGCPLLKSMLMPRDASYDEFMEKVETKLSEVDLTLYYEDADGDKVEIDDEDSIALFFSQNEKENKLKIIAFPAELVSTRMARAFANSPGGALSARSPPRTALASARSGPATSRGGWQSTMGTVEFTSQASPRVAHGRRTSVASNYDRAAALSARRMSADTTTGAT
eukprot:TRINITY_DN20355_c1_g1_i1.p1 TRINITY_DN20355_c1_g1~~TRINITY_DN20355_c1_g1_i1.p1  ORF type:complete len:325 (+),score=108.46 TRINITY_DN20355_c1_g1_i1:83-976(+)